MKLYDLFYQMFGMHIHGEGRAYYSNVPVEYVKRWCNSMERYYKIEIVRASLIAFMFGTLMGIGILTLSQYLGAPK